MTLCRTRRDHIAECDNRARGGCLGRKCSNTVCSPHDRRPGKSRSPGSPMRGSARRMSRRKSFPGNSDHLLFMRKDSGRTKPEVEFTNQTIRYETVVPHTGELHAKTLA